MMSGILMELQNENDFQTEMQNGIVLVDFFATWCRPCQMQLQILDGVVEKVSDGIKILKVDVDKFGNLVQQYQISGVPTLVVFKDGNVVERFNRVQQEETLVRTLQAQL